jgi:hypothetical protein
LLARGKASVTICRDRQSYTHDLTDYSEALPQLLGVAPEISRIEVRQDTFEDVVLSLINEGGENNA